MILGLAKTILFLLTFYYLFKFIGRLALPYVMKKSFEKMQQQQQNRAGSYQKKAKEEEGKVTIKMGTKTKSSSSTITDDGEYVDFEEIK